MRTFLRRGLAVITFAALPACTGPGTTGYPQLAQLAVAPRHTTQIHYKFVTLDDPLSYSNFNRLLGINNVGRIAGYAGSGSVRDPSNGFKIYPPYGETNFHKIIYPSSIDTVATSVNNKKLIAGYYVDVKGKTYGFTYAIGVWSTYAAPEARGKHSATKILAVNDSDTAVGTFESKTKSGSFLLDLVTGVFRDFHPPGTNGSVTGINGNGDTVGYTTERGHVVGFIRKNGEDTPLLYPGAVSTQFWGITAFDMIGGSYVDRAGTTHGFLLQTPLFRGGPTWQPIDDPDAAGTTVVTSVNIHKDLVGYYVDSSGATHGFLATPSTSR
jgi:hypothetical protein